MRVVAVTPSYLPSRVGAWLATHRLLTSLVDRGHEVSVFACNLRLTAYEIDGIVVETGLRGNGHADTLAAGADVVVSHFGDGGIGAQVATNTRRPSIRIAHGGGPHGPEGCNLAVFNSHSLRDAWVWDGPSVIANPVVDAADHRVETTGDRITIVNCTKPKGIKTAWRAAERLPDHAFLGVRGGYGYHEPPRTPNFRIIPTQDDMRAVWSQTRILLMPSAYETWGMAGVEAMCSGIPVIAHPTPGLVESLGDAGIFVDRDDTDGWVDAIRTLDDPDAYQAASDAARARFAELEPEMRSGLDRFADAVEALCVS